jgi:hypothetical protein
MNATHMMVSQAGIFLAGVLWGTIATTLGVNWALFSASALGIAGALTAKRWIDRFLHRNEPGTCAMGSRIATSLRTGRQRWADHDGD